MYFYLCPIVNHVDKSSEGGGGGSEMTKALKQQKGMHSLKHYNLLGMNILDPIKKI